MIEKIDIKDASIAEEIRRNMNVATAENKGLMPTERMRLDRRIETVVSRVIYDVNYITSMSTSLLISIAAYGGGPMTLFYMTINRANGALIRPTIILNRIGGAPLPPTPRFKVFANETNGFFKIILERTQHTPAIYVKILNVINVSSDSISFSEASQGEVDAATYIEVTPV